jgi:hypothetical protein
MQTCGSFQLGRKIDFSDGADVFSASSPKVAAAAVVKVWRTFDEADARLVLEAVKAQAAAVAAGCRYILPIYESGLDSNELPCCASPECVLSVRRMIKAENEFSAGLMESVIAGVLVALDELAAKCGRPHGNLSSGNILLTHEKPSARGFKIYLSDLAPPESAGTYRDDLVALGRIIYQMVRRNERGSRYLNPPLKLTDDWLYLGKEADRWLTVCNHLLEADAVSGPLAIAHAREALRRKSVSAPPSEVRTPRPQTAPGRWPAVVMLGLLVLAIASEAVWQLYAGQIAAHSVPQALFQQWLEPGRLDATLQVRLRGVPREKDGNIRIREIDAVFRDWFRGELKSQKPWIWGSDDVVDALSERLTRTISFTTQRDLAALPAQVQAARAEFPRWVAITLKREDLLKREQHLQDGPYDADVKAILCAWVQAQANPDFRSETFDGPISERTMARFEQTLKGIETLQGFLSDPANDFDVKAALAGLSDVKSWGDNGAQMWIDHVRHIPPPLPAPPVPEPTPESTSVATLTTVKAGPITPPPIVAPVVGSPPPPPPPPPAVVDEFAAQKKALNEYLNGLQDRIRNAGFNVQLARQEQQKLFDLQSSDTLKGVDDPRLRAVQIAFEKLFAAGPQFKLGSLLANHWTEMPGTAGADYAVYSHIGAAGQTVKMPFHRIPADGNTPEFAISAIEMPLSLAVAVGGPVMSDDARKRTAAPRGPQVWVASPSGIQPARSWLPPAIAKANEYMNKNPQFGRPEAFYSSVKDAPPGWDTPVNDILPDTAGNIARALGGRLPSLAEWKSAVKFARADEEHAHRPGLQFQREWDKVRQAEARIGKSFSDTDVGAKINPETGSYQVAPRPTAPRNGEGDLWFSKVNRESDLNPERVYDLIGNVAEIVTAGPRILPYYAIGGSSISPGDYKLIEYLGDGKRDETRKSDVGFRLVVEVQTTDEPLRSFISTVLAIK